MPTVVINPGSGPVKDATLEHAINNIQHFLLDCEIRNIRYVRVAEEDSDGRFAFLCWKDNACWLVEMPGIPLHMVRFMSEPGQDAWDYPRLYVDGSSWLWCFALRCITHLGEED